MRVIVMIKADPNDETNYMPSEAELAAMGKYNEDVMLAGEGLAASSKGKRIKLSGDNRIVTDGPFTESKEIIAGFWIWQVKSMDEAVEWARRCPNTRPDVDGQLEIRPIMEAGDFGDEFTPELQAQEEKLRAQAERNTRGK